QDHIDVLGRNDASLFLVGDAEAVREIQGLACGQKSFQRRPVILLASVGEQILDDGPLLGRLVQRKQRLAIDPAVLLGEIPTAAGVAQADNDMDAVILHIERLPAPLNAVPQDRDRFLAENGLEPLRRIIRALNHGFGSVANLNLPHEEPLSTTKDTKGHKGCETNSFFREWLTVSVG